MNILTYILEVKKIVLLLIFYYINKFFIIFKVKNKKNMRFFTQVGNKKKYLLKNYNQNSLVTFLYFIEIK